MIKVENLESGAGRFRLKNVNLDVGEGEYFVVLGPTGSGKSVLVEHIAGIRRPRSGGIFIAGKDVTGLPPEKRRVGYVPQDFVLFPFLNVKRNIEFGLRRGFEPDGGVGRIVELLGLGKLLSRDTVTLSGGEKQRVALARALAANPVALLLDEPFSALDAGFRHRLWIEMKKLQSELKTTLIHITHDLEEAFTLGGRIAVLIDGAVAQCGSREDVFYTPRSRGTAEFLGIQNIFRGAFIELDRTADRAVISCGSAQLTAPFSEAAAVGEEVDCCIRPQEIKIIKPGKPVRDSLRENVFTGAAIATIPHGNHYTIYFKSAGGSCGGGVFDFEIRLPAMAYEKMDIAEGKTISISLRKQAIRLLERD